VHLGKPLDTTKKRSKTIGIVSLLTFSLLVSACGASAAAVPTRTPIFIHVSPTSSPPVPTNIPAPPTPPTSRDEAEIIRVVTAWTQAYYSYDCATAASYIAWTSYIPSLEYIQNCQAQEMPELLEFRIVSVAIEDGKASVMVEGKVRMANGIEASLSDEPVILVNEGGNWKISLVGS
jgi:hypothetical protein